MSRHPLATGAGGILAACLVLGAAAPARAQSTTIVNDSDWDIHYLFLSLSSDPSWGPDQLGDEVLFSGQWIELWNVPCANYDLQLIDEDGDVCVVQGRYLCGDTVVISDADLLTCQGDTAVYGAADGAAVSCGLGFELAFVVPPLAWLHRRRRLRRRRAGELRARGAPA